LVLRLGRGREILDVFDMKEKKMMSLPGIEPRILGLQACGIVTVMTELPRQMALQII
jgi:hypothetical protein